MLKKIFAVLLSLLSIFCFCACGTASSAEEKIELTYGKKYIYSSDANEPAGEQAYMIFYEDGTMESHNYSVKSDDKVTNFTIYGIYDAVPKENTVFCFYDSVEYDKSHTSSTKANTFWCTAIMCSKNVIMLTDGSKYILESYLEKIPNYGE